MEYTIRSSYAEMPPQVIAANSDRRAVEQAHDFMFAVGSEMIPALRGELPSESGEAAAFAVFRDGEVIYRGLVAMMGEFAVVASASELVEKGQNWSMVNADRFATDRIGRYTVDSPEGTATVLARDDGDALEEACLLHLHDPDGRAIHAVTPFAVFSEEDGHLVGVGVQCMVRDECDGAHSFSRPAEGLLGWFAGIEAVGLDGAPG